MLPEYCDFLGYQTIIVDRLPEDLQFIDEQKKIKTSNVIENNFLKFRRDFGDNDFVLSLCGLAVQKFLNNYAKYEKHFIMIPGFDIFLIDFRDPELKLVRSIVKLESVNIINADIFKDCEIYIKTPPPLDILIQEVHCFYARRKEIKGISNNISYNDIFRLFCDSTTFRTRINNNAIK